MSRSFLLSAVLLVLIAPPAMSQEVHGRVVDSTSDSPLGGALLVARGSLNQVVGTTLSGPAGDFRLRVRRAATVRIRVERFGYAWVESVPITIGAGEAVSLEMRLRPEPIQLPEIVAATGRAVNLDSFLKRREQRKFGQFLGPLEISEMRPNSYDDLLSRLHGLQRSTNGPGIVATRRYVRLRPVVTACHPWVYIDGKAMEPWRVAWRGSASDAKPAPEPTSVDFYLRLQRVRGVEVYRAPYDAPAQYQRGTNGLRDSANLDRHRVRPHLTGVSREPIEVVAGWHNGSGEAAENALLD